MLSDDEVLALVHAASQGILRFASACGLGVQACVIWSELQNAAKSGKVKSLCAYEVCRKALELYLRESGFGKLFHIVNSRLRKVKSIRDATRDCYLRAVTDSCGDLADFVRLVWEGLNFEFSETPRRKVTIYRGVELPERALECYRDNVGKLFTWSMFSSFTEKREVAERCGRAWREGIPVMFELCSAWCRRLRDGSYLLHPFAVLRVEAVAGDTVKIVEVLEPALITDARSQCPGVTPEMGDETALHRAAWCGDVRAIVRLATGPESLNIDVRRSNLWTPLHGACRSGELEAVKALVWLGADVNAREIEGGTPMFVASQWCHESVVRLLASLGADVNGPIDSGATPLFVASLKGEESIVRALAAFGANVNTPDEDGVTPICIASQEGHASVVHALASLEADVNRPGKTGATPVYVASQEGHEAVVRVLASFGANVNTPMNEGVTPVCIASRMGRERVVRVLASLGADVNAACKRGWTPLMVASQVGHVAVVTELLKAGASPRATLPDGRNALAIAKSKGHGAVVTLLERA